MGKGNRARLRRDEDALAMANSGVKSNKTKSKGVPLWAGNLILASFALLLVGVVLFSFITSSGILLKLSNYGSTADFELSGSQMNYLFKTVYNDFLAQYSSYLSYFGLNTSLSLKDQKSVYTDDDGKEMTWFEVFAEQTNEQAKQLLVLCQMAHNEGLDKLSEKDKKSIDDAINEIAQEALQYGYSLSSYIKAIYGGGVSEKDIRTVMEYQIISANYYNVVKDRLLEAIGDDRIDSYFNENQNKFLSIDYLTYTIKVTKGTYKADAEQSVKDEVEKKYTDSKATAEAYAAKFADAKTSKDFFAILVDYLMETLFEEEFTTEYDEEFKSLKDNEKHTDDQKAAFKTSTLEKLKAALLEIDVFAEDEKKEDSTDSDDKKEELEKDNTKKAEKKVYDDLLDTFTTAIEGTYVKSGAYVEENDLSTWLFDAARKANDVKVDKEESEKKDSYTVDVNFVTKEKYKDTSITKNVGHILFTTSVHKDPEAKAKEILKLYQDGEKTREAFEALGNEHTEDSSVFYENVYDGQMVAEFNDWLFDEARKVGDTDVVKTTHGYHVMYFDGDGDERWHMNVENAIFSEDYEKWYEEAVTSTAVNINEKNMNKIDV